MPVKKKKFTDMNKLVIARPSWNKIYNLFCKGTQEDEQSAWNLGFSLYLAKSKDICILVDVVDTS